MTITEYISAGFRLSNVVSQAQIDACEAIVTDAYILPIVGQPTVPYSDEVKSAVMVLAFLRLLKINAFATRSGAKVKNAPQSANVSDGDATGEWALVAHRCLEVLRGVEGANKDAKIYDVCGIYFKTNFINI